MKTKSNDLILWMPVPEWPKYEVSSDGQVRSWNTPGFKNLKPRFPKYRRLIKGKDGYLRLTLFENSHSENRRIETWSIHRLVAMCFVPTDDKSLHVAHLDGDKTNNNFSNLSWVTRKENESHKLIHGTLANGSKNGQSKLCDKAVLAIRKLAKDEKWTQKKISNLFQISQQNISAILQGKSWFHL